MHSRFYLLRCRNGNELITEYFDISAAPTTRESLSKQKIIEKIQNKTEAAKKLKKNEVKKVATDETKHPNFYNKRMELHRSESNAKYFLKIRQRKVNKQTQKHKTNTHTNNNRAKKK